MSTREASACKVLRMRMAACARTDEDFSGSLSAACRCVHLSAGVDVLIPGACSAQMYVRACTDMSNHITGPHGNKQTREVQQRKVQKPPPTSYGTSLQSR